MEFDAAPGPRPERVEHPGQVPSEAVEVADDHAPGAGGADALREPFEALTSATAHAVVRQDLREAPALSAAIVLDLGALKGWYAIKGIFPRLTAAVGQHRAVGVTPETLLRYELVLREAGLAPATRQNYFWVL